MILAPVPHFKIFIGADMASRNTEKHNRLERKVANRESGIKNRISILCEDEKSFRYYIKYFLQQRKFINTQIKSGKKRKGGLRKGEVVVHIEKAVGTDPINIVKQGKKILKNKEANRVYCVFDYDGHSSGRKENYDKAISASSENLIIINSSHCYEVWLLLHLGYSTHEDKDADETIRRFEERMQKEPGWEKYKYEKKKDDKELFKYLYTKYLNDAKTNAIKLDKHNQKTDSKHPCSKIYKLIDDLEVL